jgi:hypothetical protein
MPPVALNGAFRILKQSWDHSSKPRIGGRPFALGLSKNKSPIFMDSIANSLSIFFNWQQILINVLARIAGEYLNGHNRFFAGGGYKGRYLSKQECRGKRITPTLFAQYFFCLL